MSGPVKVFKTQRVGGYDRADVIAYVRELAGRSNFAEAEMARASEELAAARGEIAKLSDALHTETEARDVALEAAEEAQTKANAEVQKAREAFASQTRQIREEADARIARAEAEAEAARRQLREFCVSEKEAAKRLLSEIGERFDAVSSELRALCAGLETGEAADDL
jgi:chromosome segregation ATPase